jgi:hypothetical protein
VQGQHWKATLISLLSEDYLLEDEQGLNMGEMLMVNFRQHSYEFTFNVGVDLLF